MILITHTYNNSDTECHNHINHAIHSRNTKTTYQLDSRITLRIVRLHVITIDILLMIVLYIHTYNYIYTCRLYIYMYT